ncbi:sigma 54-interacting transcriptional regulator [Lentibacillus halodurans]
MTATNKDLGNMVKKKKFREDLYYRLNGVQITLRLRGRNFY